MGGTFNPVHIGHLLLAEGAREAVPLDQVLWVPALIPPHKRVDAGISGRDRAHLVELAISDHPSFRISRVELERPAPSYTIDTVEKLQSESQGQNHQWFFLIGSDIAGELAHWKQIDRLLALVEFVVISRPGHSMPRLLPCVRQIQVQTVEVSASEIRKKIREGRSIRTLVPESVRRYIEEKGLYR